VSPRSRTLTAATVLSLALLVAMLFLPVRYVALGPGEADDTLGSDPRRTGVPVLAVTGVPTYPTNGKLLLTTVSVNKRMTMLTALARWLDSAYAVVPLSVVEPPGRTSSQVDQQNAAEMTQSQDDATCAALAEAAVPQGVYVSGFSPRSRAGEALRVGDQVARVQGKTIFCTQQVAAALSGVTPGAVADVVVHRGGAGVPVRVTTTGVPGGGSQAILGILPEYRSAAKVTIGLTGVGGPSAGLMFALGILDKITTGNLTDGRVVAGTGTISPSGDVGLIGGIQQKLLGARARGATVFLVPADNCREASSARVAGLQLVRVPAQGGLHAAREDLLRLAKGDTALPHC